MAFGDPENELDVFSWIDQEMEFADTSVLISEQRAEEVFSAILAKRQTGTKGSRTRSIAFFRGWWAAASVLLVMGVGLYWLLRPQAPVMLVSKSETDIVAPQINRARITLSNGNNIPLDSLNNGQVVLQDDVKLTKQSNGQITYQADNSGSPGTMPYNILTNPNGSRPVCVTLSDGTKVWVNVGSSITYPVAFTGNERKVFLTGEAYFEVTRQPEKKFIVQSGHSITEVLGTHFNIHAYKDEQGITTTLIEGAVRVLTDGRTQQLAPGQQAIVDNGNIKMRTNVDVEQVLAWKNGIFNFNQVDVPGVMSQLSRWYDVDVVYNGPVPQRKFWGKIQRELKLVEVLEFLQGSGLNAKLEGKKIVVSQ
ncbi:FecR domain-containing protein [Chitinophaga sp. OAE865]|uniref:FecR family protein n=1 Tax=Chitinophaga sp. OAE865 TaxID=2817898 RepID=UPI001AE3C7D3